VNLADACRLGVLVVTSANGTNAVAVAQPVVRLTVADSAGIAIPNPEASLNGRAGRVGPGGKLLFTDVAPGRYNLLVRAVGFSPFSGTLDLSPSDTLDFEVRLISLPQQLAPVVTTVPAPESRSPRLAAFEERRKMGLGEYFTRSDLARREHSSLDNVLRTVTGVQLVRRPVGCGGGYALASGRGGQSLESQPWMACVGHRRGNPDVTFEVACYFAIVVDGIKLWTPGQHEPPNVQTYSVVGLDAIEVYRGAAELPVQYQGVGSACGAVLLWTRS